jgi:hypothetical protein
MRVPVTNGPDINVTSWNKRGIALYQAGAHICLGASDVLGLVDAIVEVTQQSRKEQRCKPKGS